MRQPYTRHFHSFLKRVRLISLPGFFFIFVGMTSQAQTGGALNFTNGDYVDLGPSFNSLAFGTSPFTLETWFKTSMTEGTIMSKRSVCNVSSFWNLRISSGKIRFEMMETGGVNTVDLSTPLTYNNNVWHHVAVTRSGTTVKIFMDGYAVATNTASAVTNLSNQTDPIKLGQSACTNFIGELDETRLWTEVQSVCEIYANKNYEFNSTLSTLKFNAHYNQGSAGGSNASVTSLTNSASNAIAGTLNTFALTGTSSNWVSSSCPAQGLSAIPPSIQTTNSCGSYVWEGITYPTSGTYTRTLTSVVNGCDSLAQLNLTVNASPSLSVSASNNTICSGSNASMTVINATELSYCTPILTNNSVGNDYLSFVNINLVNSASGESSTGYTYYNGVTMNASVGSNTLQLIIDTTFAQGLAMWIDYNQDGDFNDVNEYYPFAVFSSPILGGTFTVPPTAKNGITRIRVACRRGVVPAANQSCGGYDYGEFEDYKINITGGVTNSNITWLPSTFLTSAIGETVSINNITSATTYTVTVTDINGCSATATKSIGINPLPSTPIISSSGNNLCSGTTMTLTNSPNYCTPTVSGSNVSGQHFINLFQLNSTPVINNASGDGPGIYNHYQNNIGTIPVNTPVSILVGHGGTISTSKAVWVDLNQDGDFSDAGEFLLSASSSTASLSSLIIIPSTAYNGLTRMRVAVSSASGITSGQSCSGFIFGEYEDYNLNITGGFNATTWTPSSPLNASTGNPVQIINQTANTTYTVTISDANGCTNTDTHTISYSVTPNVTVTSSADSVCAGLPVTLTASGAQSYSWLPAISNGVAFTPTTTTTYTVTGTATNGCTKTTTKQVKVLSLPTTPIITGPSSACIGDNVLLTSANYCIPTTYPLPLFDSTYSISRVIIGDPYVVTGTGVQIPNTQFDNTTNLDSAYSDFTNLVANFTAGNMYSVYTQPQGSQAVYLIGLIDYNQDGVFDISPTGNEAIMLEQPAVSIPNLSNFIVPSTAKNGLTRMRLVASSADFSGDIMCYIHDAGNLSIQAYGEFEDYSVNITGGMPSNITWAPTASLSNSNGAGTFATLNSTTTYTVTNTSSSGCSATSTHVVNAANPSVSIISFPSQICSGSSVSMSVFGTFGQTITSYNWQPGNLTGSTVTVSPTQTTTYTVTVTNSMGCTATATNLITVLAVPEIPAVFASPLNSCIGQQASIDLSSVYCSPTVANDSSSNYYISNFNLNFAQTINNSSGEEPNNYTYFSNLTANLVAGDLCFLGITIGGTSGAGGYVYIDFNQDGDFNDANELVFSNNSLSGSFNGSFTIPFNVSNGITRMRVACGTGNGNSCSGFTYGEYEDYNVNITGGINTYLWSPSSLLTNTIGSKITTVPLSSNTTYTVTATSSNGCTATATKTVDIGSYPIITATAMPNTICIGDTAQLQYSPAAIPKSLLFDFDSAPGVINSAAACVFNIQANNDITITSLKCHLGLSVSSVQIWYKPGGYGNASVTSSSGWLKLGGDIPILSPNLTLMTAIPFNQYLKIQSGQTYGIMIITNGHLSVHPDTSIGTVYTSNVDFSLTVGQMGSAFNLGSGPKLWYGQVNYVVGNIVSQIWSPASSLTDVTIYNPKAIPLSTTNYQVTVTTANGCTSSSSVQVNVNNLPNISVNGPNAICPGSSATLIASGASSYNWQPGNINGASLTVNPAQTTTYTVTATNSNGCTKTATKILALSTPLNPVINTTATTICSGTSLNLFPTLKSILGPSITIADFAPGNPFPATLNISGLSVSNTHLHRVYINGLSHTFPGDIDMWLKAPNGQIVMLMSDAGYGFTISNGNIVFEDGYPSLPQLSMITGGTYKPTNYEVNGTNEPSSPSTQLNYFSGDMNGTWELYVRDDEQPDAGSINSFQLEFYPDSTNTSVNWAANPIASQSSISNPGAFSTNVSPTNSTIYTATVTDANGCSNTGSVSITVDQCNTNLSLKLFIQGYYTGSQTMTPVKMNEGIGNSTTDVDVITVELHNATAPYALVATTTATLKTDGTALANFANSYTGSYYVVVKHRNAIQTWSANPVLMNTSSNYDFTTAANKAYGDNQISVGNGQYAFYNGDVNQDENIDLIDASMLETDINAFQFGYYSTDINGDGNVDLLDAPIVENNINGFIFSSHP